MTSDVVLSAALRNNLLSLQKTQGLIDTAQLRLSTGKKVNSALDNPQNFFASQALQNRASDLTRLLDGIGQNIQVIKAADNGITALTNLVEQADSIAQSARDALSQGSSEARATGDKDLSGIVDLTDLSGITTAGGDTFVISVTDPDDGSLIDFDTVAPLQQDLTITIAAGDSIDELVTQINDNNNITTPVVEASLDADGRLSLRTTNGGDLSVDFVTVGDSDAENLALAEALGFGTTARIAGDGGAGTQNVSFTASADTNLTSFQLYADATQTNLADRSDLLQGLFDDSGNQIFNGLGGGETFDISVNGGAVATINVDGTQTIQGFIDDINGNAAVNELIEANFDETSNQITIRSLDAEVEDVTISITGGAGDDINFGFGATDFSGLAGGGPLGETIRFGQGAAYLAELETEYDNVRAQIDELVTNGDTGYRGTNLLNGDDLTSFFNEFRSSSLTTEGVTFNSAGLGLDEANFASAESVDTALTDARAALENVRNFGTTLANDLAIIQTREDFTNNLINTLNEGSDKLTIADQNEEGAKLLALQTRQQLGVTSLSLASQSQQSVLRLF